MPPSNTKPCHNCRRRRLRCDRSWPTCHKCAVSGQECLGYGKVFVWTQGIDSQGNVNPPPGRRIPDDGDVSGSSSLSVSPSPPGQQPGHGLPRPQPRPDPSDQHPLAQLVQQAREQAAQQMNRQQSPQADSPLQPPGALTDPLFQDLDRTSRYYLSHCQSTQQWRFPSHLCQSR